MPGEPLAVLVQQELWDRVARSGVATGVPEAVEAMTLIHLESDGLAQLVPVPLREGGAWAAS